MGCKVLTKGDWRTLVEKNAHLCRFKRASCMLKHCPDLRERDTRKPNNKVRDVCPILEILK